MTFIFSSEIKDKSVNEIKSFYNKEVKISSSMKFSIPKNLKNSIQAETKQKFYRNQIFYWIVEIDDKKHYRLTGNIIRELIPMQNIVLERLANFSTKVYNLVIL